MSDYLKILEQQEALRRPADPLWGVRSQIDAVNLGGVRSQIDAINLSGVLNQIDAVNLAGVRNQIDAVNLTGVRNQIDAVNLAAVRNQIDVVASFRYPGLDEAVSLAHKAIVADQLTSRIFSDVDLQLKMQAMNHAWLRPDATSSALGFAAMQTMGRALDQYRPFEPDLALALRKNLGDWRDVVEPTFPTILDASFDLASIMNEGSIPRSRLFLRAHSPTAPNSPA